MIYYEGVEDVPLDLTPRDLTGTTLIPGETARMDDCITMRVGQLKFTSLMTDDKVPVHLYHKLVIEGQQNGGDSRNFEFAIPEYMSSKHVFILLMEEHMSSRHIGIAFTDDKTTKVAASGFSPIALVTPVYTITKIYLTL